MKKTILALLILLLLPQTVLCQERSRAITVTGHSIMTVAAEYAQIHAQLKVVSSSVEESYQAVTATVSEIGRNLQPLGVTKEDLTVSVITQGTEYEWRNNSRIPSGYYSSCSLLIKVDAIGDMYRIHSELSRYPDLTAGHTVYGRNDEYLLRIAALQEALKAAQTKARAMAETLGAKLGPVLNIRESGALPVPVVRQEGLHAARAADPGEVSTTGSVAIRGDVVVDFEIR